MNPPDLLSVDAALAALLADPARAGDLPPERATALLIQFAALQVALAARLQAMPSTVIPVEKQAEGDRYLTVLEAALALNKKVQWLYRNHSKLKIPTRIFGKSLRFPERELRKWAANQRT
jgi:hypothetical protein